MLNNRSQVEALMWLRQGLNYTKHILAQALHQAVNFVSS